MEQTQLFNPPIATGIMEQNPKWVWEDGDGDGNPLYIVAHGPNVTCPVWGDLLGPNDVTAVVPTGVLNEAVFSLEYKQGSECISRQKLLSDGMIALRSSF